MSVYANGLEVAGKAKKGKSIACFPDPCFTPKSVVPFANTTKASDTANATKTVFIEGKPVMQKDKSYFKTSSGNEAAKGRKGVTTGVKKGKAYFTSWSMNVSVEGYNVCRHSDTMTHNHGSTGNTTVWHYKDGTDKSTPPRECYNDCVEIEKACNDHKKNCKTCPNQSAEDACGGADDRQTPRDQAQRASERQNRGRTSALLALVDKALKRKGIRIGLNGTWKSGSCFPCVAVKAANRSPVQGQIDCLQRQKDKILESLENIDELIAEGVDWDDLPELAEEFGLEYLQNGSIFIPTPTKILKVAGCLMSDGGLCADLINLYAIPDQIVDVLKDRAGQVNDMISNIDDTLLEAEEWKKMTPAQLAAVQERCAQSNDCLARRKCMLEPYSSSKGIGGMLGNEGCCPGQTAHHLIPNSMYQSSRKDNSSNVAACPGYDHNDAPNVCVEGADQNIGSHGEIHTQTANYLGRILSAEDAIMTYDDAQDAAIRAFDNAFPRSNCERRCLEKQLEHYRDSACNGSNPRLRKVNGMSSKIYAEPEDDCPV